MILSSLDFQNHILLIFLSLYCMFHLILLCCLFLISPTSKHLSAPGLSPRVLILSYQSLCYRLCSHLYANNFEFTISLIFICLLGILTQISVRHFRVTMSKTRLLIFFSLQNLILNLPHLRKQQFHLSNCLGQGVLMPHSLPPHTQFTNRSYWLYFYYI